ncbi:SDR family oxidoreductase [Erwinia tracheiphila]|uniref:SDR family NAD(P)-dependent oxidoreductase n=1 Tax=Erwinia tracheiphila TaxID=65700 RepID=A0A345CSD0_9GAMM|nr:SDR family oxidoreductase [Erwinia tracheiphila]AXF76347.1 SDR family NAD(P)-dependent oxidoreductase [Erwinia tracheiphila]UIA84991.1 SDR family oxidoreductase [Erwinia tracheiphila]UIA93587.1 SDR family oxidoreductase [Erwinia tracheiphila]
MRKVAIVGLGWLGMPLGLSLMAHGWHVTGTKTTADGVEAVRKCGIEGYCLKLNPELVCKADDLKALLNADALVITLPASRTAEGSGAYLLAVQQMVDSALSFKIPRIIFTSSTSVYGNGEGAMKENSPLQPTTVAGKTLKELEAWLHDLPGTSVDVLRLAGLVGPGRHPGRFLAGKTGLADGSHGVNLVHLDDVISAITLLLQTPKGGRVYNLSASAHPARNVFYPAVARQLGLTPPVFMAQTDAGSGKLIDGSRLCQELGFDYQYPDPMKMPL